MIFGDRAPAHHADTRHKCGECPLVERNIQTVMENFLPISEQYRLAADAWVDADNAANLLEETKSARFSQLVLKLLSSNPKLAMNRAETQVKASPEWVELIETMVEARGKANRLRISVDVLRMRAMEYQSLEATKRAEMRI